VPFLAGPNGPIDCLVTGSGTPITVFAHGFGGSIAETRLFGSGVVGTRVFFHFRGHGGSADSGGPWTYAGLESELCTVREGYEASRALGVSLGAGALISAAAHRPGAFERLVLVLPPAVDRPRGPRAIDRIEPMAQRADLGDVDGIARLLVEGQPAAVRDSRMVRAWAHQRAERLCDGRLRVAIRQVPLLHPLKNRSELEAIGCPTLVIAQHGDDAHPVRVARRLAEALPDAELILFEPGGVPWTQRAGLRDAISGFLNR
jgi:pimeloyl-ACP methyl ester carboxylesterase